MSYEPEGINSDARVLSILSVVVPLASAVEIGDIGARNELDGLLQQAHRQLYILSLEELAAWCQATYNVSNYLPTWQVFCNDVYGLLQQRLGFERATWLLSTVLPENCGIMKTNTWKLS